MAERHDLLLEVGTEELPPQSLAVLGQALQTRLVEGLTEQRIANGAARWFATPRRLAVLVHEVAPAQPDYEDVRRGPALKAAFDEAGAATSAARGFARSCGVSVDQLETIEQGSTRRLAYRTRVVGRKTGELLAGIVERALGGLPVPKRMRWGAGEVEFVRPVHWMVLKLDATAIDAELLGVKTGSATWGHRFHCPRALEVRAPREYAQLLERQAWVIPDYARRRARVREQVSALAAELGGAARMTEALLDEVTGLVEWPVALSGAFEPEFLEVPAEALVAAMEAHQRCFPVMGAEGELLPHFIAVANIDSREPATVRAGYERVLRPRFADAAFFWHQDTKRSLASRRPQLGEVVLHHKLGSVLAKSERVMSLAGLIAERLGLDPEPARRAALLGKCDLLTDMVGEFPELQGVMGRHYALHDDEPEAVAVALEEQYRPRHASDALPQTDAGLVLALAERFDTVTGIFAVGERPSGDKDPFGLRRAALGILRILIERERDLDIEALTRRAAEGLAETADAAAAVPDVVAYLMERLRAYYAEQGVAADVVSAVMERWPTRPLDFDRRVRAVQMFRGLAESEALAAANKRIRNIVRKSDVAPSAAVEESLLVEEAERRLHKEVKALEPQVSALFDRGAYADALTRLAGLREPVDRFFDEVLVICEDEGLRRNRLSLLATLSGLFLRAADLSRLQG